jgi:hypothetical protein
MGEKKIILEKTLNPHMTVTIVSHMAVLKLAHQI